MLTTAKPRWILGTSNEGFWTLEGIIELMVASHPSPLSYPLVWNIVDTGSLKSKQNIFSVSIFCNDIVSLFVNRVYLMRVCTDVSHLWDLFIVGALKMTIVPVWWFIVTWIRWTWWLIYTPVCSHIIIVDIVYAIYCIKHLATSELHIALYFSYCHFVLSLDQ